MLTYRFLGRHVVGVFFLKHFKERNCWVMWPTFVFCLLRNYQVIFQISVPFRFPSQCVSILMSPYHQQPCHLNVHPIGYKMTSRENDVVCICLMANVITHLCCFLAIVHLLWGSNYSVLRTVLKSHYFSLCLWKISSSILYGQLWAVWFAFSSILWFVLSMSLENNVSNLVNVKCINIFLLLCLLFNYNKAFP